MEDLTRGIGECKVFEVKEILFEWFECIKTFLSYKRSNLRNLRWRRSHLSDLYVLKTFLRCRKSHILETKRPIWKHIGMFWIHWNANTYFDCKKLFFNSFWIDCRPRNANLNVLKVHPSVQWHHSKVRLLKLLISSMEGTSTFGNSKLRCCWHPWIFGILWTEPWKLHLPMQIPKCWRSTKDASRKLYLSLASTWRATNLHASMVTKNHWKYWQPFSTYMRRKICPTCFSWTPSFLRARCKKATTC